MDRTRLYKEVEVLVQEFRKNPFLELEVRLGTIHPETTAFIPGVSDKYFSLILQTLFEADQDKKENEPRVWKEFQNKHHYANAYFSNNVRGHYHPPDEPIFVQVQRTKTFNCESVNRTYDLRFGLKIEKPCPKDFKQPEEPPLHFRKCAAWLFVDRDERFRVDLRLVNSGKTREEAHQHIPRYEVEVEVLRKALDVHTDRAIAVRLVERGIDLLGRFEKSGRRNQVRFK